MDVGFTTSYTIGDLTELTYYFAVNAYVPSMIKRILHTYNQGTVVTLTGTSDMGSTFPVGWEVDAAGLARVRYDCRDRKN